MLLMELVKKGNSIPNYLSIKRLFRVIDFGTTAVIALIVDNLLVVGNSGDSQCVLGTQSERSYYLTTCHSCTNREEGKNSQTSLSIKTIILSLIFNVLQQSLIELYHRKQLN